MKNIPVFGCPRSGTSWLGQIFNSSPQVIYRFQPLFSYEFKNYFVNHGISENSADDFIAALVQARSAFVLTDFEFIKNTKPTHLVWKEVRYHQYIPKLSILKNVGPVIYIYRHPLYMINSWYHAPKEFDNAWDIRREFLDAPSKNTDENEYNGIRKWLQSTSLALECAGKNLMVVSYEKLLAETRVQVKEIFKVAGIDYSDSVEKFITESTTRTDVDPYSVYRGGKNREAIDDIDLPKEIVEEILSMKEVSERYCELASVAI